MKKFFNEYTVSVLLAVFIFFAPLAYFGLRMAFSMVADGSDPALVFIVLCVTGCLAMFVLTPVASVVVPVLAITFDFTGWLLKLSFRGILHLINRRTKKTATVTVLKSSK